MKAVIKIYKHSEEAYGVQLTIKNPIKHKRVVAIPHFKRQNDGNFARISKGPGMFGNRDLFHDRIYLTPGKDGTINTSQYIGTLEQTREYAQWLGRSLIAYEKANK
jgi:hypothetical protein